MFNRWVYACQKYALVFIIIGVLLISFFMPSWFVFILIGAALIAIGISLLCL